MSVLRIKGRFGFLQPQDVAWGLFVLLLLVTAPEPNNDALILVPLIGAFQILEPRLKLIQSRPGQIASIALKLLLCYFLIGFSDAIFSYYYPVFLIPVVSAAAVFDLGGTLLVIALASAGYASYLLPPFLDWNRLPPGFLSVVASRIAFYAIIGFLVYQEARGKRIEMKRTQEALDRLTESNRNLRAAEASLRRSERLAALGQLTAGLAHELRNPLATIHASAETLGGKIGHIPTELLSEVAGYIGSEVDRMNALIARFLNFARPLSMKAILTELAPVLDDVVRQQAELAETSGVSPQRAEAGGVSPELAKASGVSIEVAPFDRELRFAFDPDLLKVALTNLVQNAIQASTAGQSVQIRVAPGEGAVRILVSDHGAGIPSAQLENIFNPFFTTKPNGVGLGLALVSKIVDEHRGHIEVFSEPGKGTTFEVSLPKEQPGH